MAVFDTGTDLILVILGHFFYYWRRVRGNDGGLYGYCPNQRYPTQVGVATSFNTLLRTIGQTIMVAVFGIVLNTSNSVGLAQAQVNDSSVMNQLVDPAAARQLPTALLGQLREILYSGLHWVFGIGVLLIVLAIGLTRTISRESGTI